MGAVVFVDGYDYYTAAQGGAKYTTWGGANSMATGRRGSAQCVTLGTVGFSSSLPANYSALRVCYGWQPPNANTVQQLFGLFDGSTNQLNLRTDGSGRIQVYRNTTLLATSTLTFNASTWYYVEWYATIANSIAAGGCVVRLNGVEYVSLAAGTDTQQSATAQVNGFSTSSAFTAATSFTNSKIDDLYIEDRSSDGSAGFLGDRAVLPKYVSADTAQKDFTASSGSDNYAMLDEAQASDSDYVYTTTVGHVDLYDFAALGVNPTSIKAVQLNMRAYKDDATARVARMVWRSGGANYESGDCALSTSALLFSQIRETDPATSAAWTTSGVNALQAGPKLQS